MSQSIWRVWKRRTMNGKYILRISLAISLSHPPIASRSSFPHTLRMVLVQKILKRSTPMPMQQFVRIPPSSQPKRQKIGKLNARNMLHLVSLTNNGKPKSNRRLRRSKPVVAPQTRMKTKMRMMNNRGIPLLRGAYHMPSHVMHLYDIFVCSS